jgi:hypothetical protein
MLVILGGCGTVDQRAQEPDQSSGSVRTISSETVIEAFADADIDVKASKVVAGDLSFTLFEPTAKAAPDFVVVLYPTAAGAEAHIDGLAQPESTTPGAAKVRWQREYRERDGAPYWVAWRRFSNAALGWHTETQEPGREWNDLVAVMNDAEQITGRDRQRLP